MARKLFSLAGASRSTPESWGRPFPGPKARQPQRASLRHLHSFSSPPTLPSLWFLRNWSISSKLLTLYQHRIFVFPYFSFNGCQICNHSPISFLTLVVCIFLILDYQVSQQDLAILFIFSPNNTLCVIDFSLVFKKNCFQFHGYLLTIIFFFLLTLGLFCFSFSTFLRQEFRLLT